MSSNLSVNPTIAFFGATGGCANACLVHTLKAGHSVAALARTPSKLKKQLLSQGVSEETLASQLLVVEGDALDAHAVNRTLTAGGDKGFVSTIVSGLGGAPKLQFDWWHPLQLFTLDNPTICGDATKTLLTALQQLYTERPSLASAKPVATFISTTGISRGPEDVPFWSRFFYHQVLAVPHIDKKNMEELYRKNMSESNPGKVLFRSIVGIRPTLLTGTESINDAVGLQKIRAGTEEKPAIGYTIRRADVGHWIFENVIKDGARNWEGQMVSLAS